MVSLKDKLKKSLNKEEIKLVPKSFDVVGNIAIFSDFPKELKRKARLVGNRLIEKHKNIKTVAIKTGKYSGRYRTPKLKIIAGKRTKETVHSESGVRINLNVEKDYFSSRSAGERLRIANLVKKGEDVLVMFAGVLPFALVISKHSKANEVYAVEINPSAYKYGLKNLKLNKLGNVVSLKGDVEKVLPKLEKRFDRILMPLPKSSDDYLETAIKKLKPKGVIHFYTFLNEKDFPKAGIEILESVCSPQVMRIVKCGNYAPYVHRVCIDFRIDNVS